MNELVERCAARAGTDSAVVRTTVDVIPDFLCKDGSADKIQLLTGTKAGAENAVAAFAGGMAYSPIDIDRGQTAPGSGAREVRTATRKLSRSACDSVEPIGWSGIAAGMPDFRGFA